MCQSVQAHDPGFPEDAWISHGYNGGISYMQYGAGSLEPTPMTPNTDRYSNLRQQHLQIAFFKIFFVIFS